MKNNIPSQMLKLRLIIAAAIGFAASPVVHAAPAKAFKFTASAANTSGSAITLDHPALNEKPKLNLIITQRYFTTYNNHATGLQYNYVTKKWVIRNEDGASIPFGAAFNVLLAPGTKRYAASPLTTNGNSTFFSVAKNKPRAILLATHIINPTASFTGVRSTHPFSTAFSNNQWMIYNDNDANMEALAFNIADVTKLKVNGAQASFRHITLPGTVTTNLGIINTPLTNGKPNAVIFAKHIYSTENPKLLAKEIGVYYTGGQWGIYTHDGSNMPLHAEFAVTVIPEATP